MKRIIGIFCQIAGVVVMAAGLLPVLHIIKQSRNVERLGYYEEIHFDQNTVLSIIILLVSIAAGIILLCLGSRLKSKRPIQK